MVEYMHQIGPALWVNRKYHPRLTHNFWLLTVFFMVQWRSLENVGQPDLRDFPILNADKSRNQASQRGMIAHARSTSSKAALALSAAGVEMPATGGVTKRPVTLL